MVQEHFEGNAQFVKVMAGESHSVVVGSKDGIWIWDNGGCLGHSDIADKHVLTLLAGLPFDGGKVVMVAAGGGHTATVTGKGVLWDLCYNQSGQLRTAGFAQVKLTPARVGDADVFGGSQVRKVACSHKVTLIVTEEGSLSWYDHGSKGALGHNSIDNQAVPTQVKAQHFEDFMIVSAAAGAFHSAVVTENGCLYVWEKTALENAFSAGLGHDDMHTKLLPKRPWAICITAGGARQRRYCGSPSGRGPRSQSTH